MGNEASRHSNGSSPLRRNSRRKSKSTNFNGGQNYIAEDEMDRNPTIQDLAQTPKPVKRMEKIRRSLSFRRKKKTDKNKFNPSTEMNSASPTANLTSSVSAPINVNNNNNNSSSSASASVSKSNSTTTQPLVNNQTTTATTTPTVTNQTETNATSSPAPVVTKPSHWIEDEKRVRAGNCSFQVKYLGSNEVSDSRGMHLCEAAIEKLLAEKEKKKPIKAILYVSGDSLRVVDESNKTLLVDQTIEKVSFCAPDRHHENGFAYICRDGTTRRWLCHCFMATKETLKNSSTGTGSTGCSGGERLSHAVGCAFSVCLEKKQKRERENVTMEVGPNHSFTRMGSFRQASLTERLEDPQIVMPANEPVPLKQVDNPHAIERPRANPDVFNRQNSLRGSAALQLQFKRSSAAYTSLKPGELPSFQQQKIASGLTNNTTVAASTPLTKTSLLMQQHQLNQNNKASPTANVSNLTSSMSSDLSSFNKKINTISEIPEEQFTLNTNEFNSNSNKLSEQLNVQTSETNFRQFNQPLTPSASNDWPNNNYQPTQNQSTSFYNLNSSLLATPQSLPATPPNTISPPPLPPMPTQYTTPVLYQSQIPLTLQQQQQHQQYLYQQQMLFQQMYPNASSLVQINQMMPMMNLQQQQPLPNVYTTPVSGAGSSMQSPSSSSVNSNETFEQKWQRIQAAKNKTNPFAEDIAKKFEIKL